MVSPKHSRVLVNVLQELTIQRNLINELLHNEVSERSPAAATPARSKERSSVTLPTRTLLNSPAPDRASSLFPPPLVGLPEVGNKSATHFHNASVDQTFVDPAIANLVEALSTSSWSSETTLTDRSDSETPVAQSAYAVSREPRDGVSSREGKAAPRSRFCIDALRVAEEECGRRESIALEEATAFKEVSSTFLGAPFAVQGSW